MADWHTARGYWLEEAGPARSAPPLETDRTADVLIVGGGFTGLWTAWQIKRIEPATRVVLCEAGACGDGPSGRNGGFANGMWFSLPMLRDRFGDQRALAVARAAQASVDQIGGFCREQGVDAWYGQDGYMQVSTAPAFDGAWEAAAAACAELGEPGACRRLTAAEVRQRCESPVFRAGALYPRAATVQPARLVHGLAERVRGRGVEVFEHTPVRHVGRRGGVVVGATPHGEVRARRAVIAAGGAELGQPVMRRRLTLTSSHMVITEPVPDVLEEIGWTGRECITDSRAMIHYFRTTPDGRIAFGWGGGRIVRGHRTGGRAEVDPGITEQVQHHLIRIFPALRGRRVEHAWGGPIDVSPTHLPMILELDAGIWAGFGYTGHGVGPSHMVGRSLASLALDVGDDASRLAIVSPPPHHVPPEPFRFVGGSLIRRALVAKETAHEQGRAPSRLSRALAAIPARIGIHIGR